jgi:drug/metabolite transporter (DMT)-like permease
VKILERPLPYILTLGFLFGSGIVITRFGIGQFDPLAFATLRMGLAALIHLAVYMLSPQRKFPTDRNFLMHAIIAGLIGTGLPTIALVIALQYQSSGITSLLITLNAVITPLIAHFLLRGERLTVIKILGAMIAFSGAAALLIRGETGLGDFVHADWHGYAWTSLIVLGLSLGSIYSRRFLRTADSFDAASIRMMISAVVFIPITWAVSGFDFSLVKPSGYLALLYTTILSTFFAFLLNFYIIKRFGAASVSQFSYVTPVVATILGAVLLSEIITPVMLMGMVMIFSGLALVTRQSNRPKSHPPSREAT